MLDNALRMSWRVGSYRLVYRNQKRPPSARRVQVQRLPRIHQLDDGVKFAPIMIVGEGKEGGIRILH